MPKQAMFSVIRWLGVAVLALGLSACGSGNDADEAQAAPAPTPTVGTGEVLAASHIGCVPPFLTFMLGQLAPVAQDL